MIGVSSVFHHYGVKPILEEISFEVDAGQTLAIIGPNGSGKTTLLNLVAGMMSPADGQVTIGGRVRRGSVDEELAIRKRTVFLPDDCWFPKDCTGRRFLLSVGEIYGIPHRRLFDHVDRLLALFCLDHLSDVDILGYSTGQRKKLGLSSALITEAEVMLLDEPFSGGLDPAGITAMKQILKHLTEREDRTVVMTSPVPELVEEVADEVLILKKGRVLAHDSVSNIREQANAETLDQALRTLIFPETASELEAYFAAESAA